MEEEHELTDKEAEEILAVLRGEQPTDLRLFCSECQQPDLFLKDGLCPACAHPRTLTFQSGPAFSIKRRPD